MRSRAAVRVQGIGKVIHEVSEVVMFPESGLKGEIVYKVLGRHTSGRGLVEMTLALEDKEEEAEKFRNQIQKRIDLAQVEDLVKRNVYR